MLTADHLTALRSGYVPGDVLPGVLEGWLGPQVSVVREESGWAWHGTRGYDAVHLDTTREAIPFVVGALGAYLPLSRPEVRAHVARVMAAGLMCGCRAPRVCGSCGSAATCFGRYEGHGPVMFACDNCCGHGNEDGWCEQVYGGNECHACRGTGYARPPAPAWHILPSGETATPLPPEWAPHAPALLACHVARVVAGLPGIRRVLPPWERDGGASHRMATDTAWACEVTADGWACSYGWSHGPETGPAGMAAADAAALAAGFALMNADGPVLPWPNPGGPDAR